MKILVVEDSEQEMRKAVEVITSAGHQAITAEYVYWGMRHLVKDWPLNTENLEKAANAPDAVISDIMVPWSYEGNKTQSPGGVLVGWTCSQLQIPFVFCTSGYHHGPSYQWVDTFTRLNKWPRMVDGISCKGETNKDEKRKKDWDYALKKLLELCNK